MSMIKPAVRGAVITPSDSSSNAYRGIYLGVSGDVNILLEGDTVPLIFKNMVAGVIHPISTKRIYATSTTATNIIGVL